LRGTFSDEFVALLRDKDNMISFRTHQKPPNDFFLFYHETLVGVTQLKPN